MLLTDPAYLVNSPEGLLGVAASWTIGITLHSIIYYIRKRQGNSLSMSYKEIPLD